MGSSTRLIDSVPDPSTPTEMEVLVLGPPRTGSISMRTAFEILGYRPFHGTKIRLEKKFHLFELWEEALRARYYGTCEVYGRREYDKLLTGWNASCNMPGALVSEDLIKAYPNAKIVLSTRDVDKWLNSMAESIYLTIGWRSFDWLAPWDPRDIGPWWKNFKFIYGLRPLLAPNGERQAYLDYYDRIGHIVPAERLLYFNVAEGWEPLCKFLGKEIPTTPFPKANNTNQFIAEHTHRWWYVVRLIMAKISVLLVVVAAVSWAVWRGQIWMKW